ncbi:MAG: aspartate aminotransferase family protein [Hyphomonadaceae bacterium]
MREEKLEAVLTEIARYAAAYRNGVGARSHAPAASYDEMRTRLDAPTPEHGAPTAQLISELIDLVEPGLAAMTAPRFFGWVIGATAPAGMAADWLASAWGQNTGNGFATPSSSVIEEVAGRWLLDVLDLPRESSIGYVTGATMANFTCLAAARSEVLRRVGWDGEEQGLFGAPPVHVVLGEEAHSTVFSALRYLGLGTKRVVSVEIDAQGRMKPDAFARAIRKLGGPIIAIAQAGHINSGAFDPFTEIAPLVREKGGWLHVDGAFGLWARTAPDRAHLAVGVDLADSWGTDGHKWLQTPHDSGYAIVRDREAHRRAMLIAASYLPEGDARHPADYTPELSRRARGFATWAMIRSLGRAGIADMVSRHCALARRMAERLAAEPSVDILNDVVLNQVAVRLAVDLDPARADDITCRTIARVQAGGECFIGGAHWAECEIVRISVIGEGTTEADIDRSSEAILAAYRAERGANSVFVTPKPVV